LFHCSNAKDFREQACLFLLFCGSRETGKNRQLEKIRQLIIKKLSEDFTILLQAARAAHAASVNEENKAENEYV